MCPLKIGTVFAQLPSKGHKQTVPLSVQETWIPRGWMTDVSDVRFSYAPAALCRDHGDPGAIHVLAQQPIDMSKPHPFVEAGNREFNMFLWMPPKRRIAQAIFCWQIPRSSRRCSAVMRVCITSGRTSRLSDSLADSGTGFIGGLGGDPQMMRAHAQNRGVYPLGMSATNSGVTPAAGFTYANQLLFYSRDHAKDDGGHTLTVTGENTVLMDMNTLAWVSKKTFVGGARYSAAATSAVREKQPYIGYAGKIQWRRRIRRFILHAVHPGLESGTHCYSRDLRLSCADRPLCGGRER